MPCSPGHFHLKCCLDEWSAICQNMELSSNSNVQHGTSFEELGRQREEISEQRFFSAKWQPISMCCFCVIQPLPFFLEQLVEDWQSDMTTVESLGQPHVSFSYAKRMPIERSKA